MENKDKSKTIYINHKAELLVWLVIVLFFVAMISIGHIHKDLNDENDFHVFLPDVDGLIVGSPVRMMGIEIGHVVKIKPVKDEVYVKFIITNPDLTVPRGTKITVEFSGMAGSKSLELYPPDKSTYIDKDTPIFDVYPPKRLRDALSMLDDMYKKITSIIWNISNFGEKLENSELKSIEPKNSAVQLKEFLQYSNTFLGEAEEKTEEIRKNIEGFKKHGE